MVRDDRIVTWNLAETVEMLLESGVKQPGEIAKRMNLMDSVQVATGDQRVLAKDIENYVEHRTIQRQDAEAKALRYSPQGQELIAQAQETIGRLMGSLGPVEALLPRGTRILGQMLETYEEWLQDGANADEVPEFPMQQIKGLRELFGLVRDVIGDVKGDEKVTQLLRAGRVEFNQQVGMSLDEVHGKIIEMADFLECPGCGFKNFDHTATLAAYGRAKVKAARVIDAEEI